MVRNFASGPASPLSLALSPSDTGESRENRGQLAPDMVSGYASSAMISGVAKCHSRQSAETALEHVLGVGSNCSNRQILTAKPIFAVDSRRFYGMFSRSKKHPSSGCACG